MQGHPVITLRRSPSGNVWLSNGPGEIDSLANLPAKDLPYEVMPSEEAVGRAMLDEITKIANAKDGPIVIVLVGGRGGQALHRLLGAMAKSSDNDALFNRLGVFTQDALAPLRMDNGLSFVRDFERLLGPDFFRKVKSFRSIRTDAEELETELADSNARAVSICSFLDLDQKLVALHTLPTSSLAQALDDNPGLWLRVHPNVRSLILADVLEKIRDNLIRAFYPRRSACIF